MAEILTGELGRIRLSSLLQLVEGELLDVALIVQDGRLCFRYGQLVEARFKNWERGLAVLELFWFRGPFRVEEWQGEGQPLASTMALVMEGSRLLDEWSRLSTAWIVPVPEKPMEGLELLTPWLDGRRTLEQVVAAGGLSRAVATERASAGIESGALRQLSKPLAPAPGAAPTVAAPAPPPAALPPMKSYADAIDAGRRLLREGRLTDAEAAFQVALQFSPNDPVARQNLRWVGQVRARTLSPAQGK